MHTMIAITTGKCINDDISRLARDDKNLGSKNFTTCEIGSLAGDSRIILYDNAFKCKMNIFLSVTYNVSIEDLMNEIEVYGKYLKAILHK